MVYSTFIVRAAVHAGTAGMLPHLRKRQCLEVARRSLILKVVLLVIIAIISAEVLIISSKSSFPNREHVERRTEATAAVIIRVNDELDTSSAVTNVTQSEDLELRGKWQMKQMESYCKKYGLENQHLVLPRIENERRILFRHILCDPKRKLAYCFLPKAGCTTLRRLFFAMQGEIPVESIKWLKISEHKYLIPAIVRTSLQNKNLTENTRLYRLKNYFKFVMIRNPLDRLVSAYRNKIEPPLEFTEYDRNSGPLINSTKMNVSLEFFQAHRRIILSKYNPETLIQWAKANGSYQLSVNFSTYVRWIVDSKDSSLNEHFSSILWNIAPCRVGYNLFLNFKNYSRDVRLLMSKLNISSDLFIDHNAHSSPEKETHSTLPHYYSQLPRELKRRLFVARRRELDFYYYLYPEEQLSHVELLGINDAAGLPEEYWPLDKLTVLYKPDFKDT